MDDKDVRRSVFFCLREKGSKRATGAAGRVYRVEDEN